jgi:hypothetical protein
MNLEDDWSMLDNDASMGQVHNMEPNKANFINVPVDMEQIQFSQYKANDG